MVNPGAIATTSLVPGASAEAKWRFIHEGLSRFAGRSLSLDAEVYASAAATNQRNQGIARLLQSLGRIAGDPADATDLYTRQCCAERQRQGPGGDGRDARGRRRQSAHRRARRRCRDLPAHAGRDDDRRPVRDLRGLALRRRAARQERDRRRDRHRLAGQGRAGHVRPAARRRRQQRQGTARPPGSSPGAWGWTCSRRHRSQRTGDSIDTA